VIYNYCESNLEEDTPGWYKTVLWVIEMRILYAEILWYFTDTANINQVNNQICFDRSSEWCITSYRFINSVLFGSLCSKCYIIPNKLMNQSDILHLADHCYQLFGLSVCLFPVCLSVPLSVCRPTCLPIYWSVCLFIYLFISLSVYDICLSVCLFLFFVCLPFCLPDCSSVWMPGCLFVYWLVCLSDFHLITYLIIFAFIWLFVCFFDCLFVSRVSCLSVMYLSLFPLRCLFVCLS